MTRQRVPDDFIRVYFICRRGHDRRIIGPPITLPRRAGRPDLNRMAGALKGGAPQFVVAHDGVRMLAQFRCPACGLDEQWSEGRVWKVLDGIDTPGAVDVDVSTGAVSSRPR